ncbi:MAG: hypothetical protein VYE18_03410 [Pseudomonadota bacterium]|nr:hypothetical protein [Pseudomonadota bacterium]
MPVAETVAEKIDRDIIPDFHRILICLTLPVTADIGIAANPAVNLDRQEGIAAVTGRAKR